MEPKPSRRAMAESDPSFKFLRTAHKPLASSTIQNLNSHETKALPLDEHNHDLEMQLLAHRPPGRGGGGHQQLRAKHATSLVLTLALCLILLANPSHSHTPQHSGDQYTTVVASTHKGQSTGAQNEQAGRSPPEIPLLKHDITTVKFRSTENDATHQNYNHALAPARNPSAVRAPIAHSVESAAGLSALSPARLLQDWEAADMVLLSTIDGRIQARNRKTGEELWAMGFDDSPMIQTTHHCHNNTEDDESQCDHEYMFIVEPTRDGTIYIQYKDPALGLQRLGVSVKSLAAETPSVLQNPPLITIAQQETSTVTVNAQTGEVISQFSKYAMGFTDSEVERKCRRITGLENDESACDTKGNINLGRVEYTIQIANDITKQKICTIKFSEWLPNKADGDLQMQYTTPLDSLYIQTKHNGRIIGLDDTAPRMAQWHDKLDSPVAQIFDVVKPLGDGEDEASNLVILTRPINSPSLIPAQAWQNDPQRLEKVYVDRDPTGMWYALSEVAYPGVTAGAERARCDYDRDSYPIDWLMRSQDLIGVHTTSAGQEEAPIRLTIDASPPERDVIIEPEKGIDSMYLPGGESRTTFDNFIPSPTNLVLFIIILLIGGSRLDYPAVRRVYRLLGKIPILDNLVEAPPVKLPAIRQDHVEDVVVPRPMVKVAEPMPSEIPEMIAPVEVDTVEVEAVTVTPIHSRGGSSELPELSPMKSAREDANDNSSGDESDIEKVDTNTADEGIATVSGEVDAKPKKKTKRGKRGGRKNNKKKTMEPEAVDKVELATEVYRGDALYVGKLKIDIGTVLGTGSNGTTVFQGTFDGGRAVAVKRLVKSTNSLAAKEIKVLLSSDENPHVVRFYGKEETASFTFIALDLFAASLNDFVSEPSRYPDLIRFPEGYDIKDCLRQITDGVAHLHSLRLIHRDIKPQNVLVKPVKTQRVIPGLPKLNFVISDFGLCKALDDGPESTFAPTINHTAAGTTGWRAPELLIGNDEMQPAISISNPPTSDSNEETKDSSSGHLRIQPSGRRVTKAIDIFSLGCVFYFVMTQGCHPFDVGGTSLARDLNIKENRFQTKDLRLHDYSYDADDLILQMISNDPSSRPDTAAILKHPYFWDNEVKLEFLCAVSDCYETLKTSIKNIHDPNADRTPQELDNLNEIEELEGLGPDVFSNGDWSKAIPKGFWNEAGRQRKYSGNKMIDLLRLVRNKKNHWQDLPEEIKASMISKGKELVAKNCGGSGAADKDVTLEGYYDFWTSKFPSLLVNVHMLVCRRELVGRMGLGRWF